MEFKLQKFKSELSITRIANIHYFEFNGDYFTLPDSHRFCELVYVEKGSLKIEAQNFNGILSENEMIIHTAEEVHSLSCIDKRMANVIVIGFECESETLVKFSLSKAFVPSLLQKILAEIIKECRTVFLPPYDKPVTSMKKRGSFTFGADQLIKNLLEYFLIKLVREYETAPPEKSFAIIINEVISYIDNNFIEKITLSELAFLFNTNITTLCREFKKATDKTIIEYINGLKIAAAKEMIATKKDLTFTEISKQLNFDSIHYFTRLFKQLSGMSPKQYSHRFKGSSTRL